MKKFILVFFVHLVANAYGQSDFPISNAIWNVKLNCSNEDKLYVVSEDTLFNDVSYSKLLIVEDTIITNEISGSQIVGFVRNDGERVLMRFPFSDIELVLYDFSKAVGDTIWHNGHLLYNSSGADFEVVLDDEDKYISIVTNKYEENGIEKYEVSTGPCNGYQYSDIWISGVGSERGVFYHLCETPMCCYFYDNNLICLKHNDTVKYFNDPQCSRCFCRYDATEILNKTIDDNVCIFPNPTHGSLSIKVAKEYTDLTIEIIDESGKVIYANECESLVPLVNFAPGIYFVRLLLDGFMSVEKIVIE